MIKRIKQIILENRANQKKILYQQHQLWANQELQSLLNFSFFVPKTGWSMSPLAIVHCLNIISIHKPKTIIEFGSGATTIYIAQLLKNINYKGQFFSVESNQSWKKEIEQQLINYELIDYVTLIEAPLTNVSKEIGYKDQTYWYDTDKIKSYLEEIDEINFIIVDGPSKKSSVYVRYSALPFLKNKISNDSIFLLDDSYRSDEKEIVDEWANLSGLKKYDFQRYTILSRKFEFSSSPYKLK